MATVIFGGFEWDSAKAVSNLAKHGVSFENATQALLDDAAIADEDSTHADRVIVIGLATVGVLFVVTVERGERARIVSARRANRHQIDRYTQRG